MTAHLDSHRTSTCDECGISVAVLSLREHQASHELTENYKTGLNKTAKKSKAKKSKEPQTNHPTKLNSYLLFCWAFRESKKQAFPTLNMMGINEKLSQNWHSLSHEEKAA